MFKQISLILAGTIALAGCSAGVTIPAPNTVAPIVSVLLPLAPSSVAAAVQTACGFAGVVGDIATLITANPAVATVQGFVNMICGVVNAKGARRGAASAIVVRGIVIHRQ